jgi:hypothetical protein
MQDSFNYVFVFWFSQWIESVQHIRRLSTPQSDVIIPLFIEIELNERPPPGVSHKETKAVHTKNFFWITVSITFDIYLGGVYIFDKASTR